MIKLFPLYLRTSWSLLLVIAVLVSYGQSGETTEAAPVDTLQLQILKLAAQVNGLRHESSNSLSQIRVLRFDLGNLEREKHALKKTTVDLLKDLNHALARTDSLQDISDELRSGLVKVESKVSNDISILQDGVTKSATSTILGGVGLLCLLGLTFWGTRRILEKRVTLVYQQINKVGTDIQEKLVILDTEILGSLQKLVQAKSAPFTPAPIAEVDHSLALKVADELTRIEQNLAQMDTSIKGHKQLTAAIKRMHENLQAAGYQLPQLLGKAFDEGMKVTAAFVPDDSLQLDERVVTRVHKPTVLFQGKMIQAGDIQVSQG